MRRNQNKNPIKLGGGGKLNDMNAFIENELKNMKNMKQKNNPTSLNSKNFNFNLSLSDNKAKNTSSGANPISVNNNMTESQNTLKYSMQNKGFTPTQKTMEDNMRSSQTKFEGFTNATKFTETNTNSSQIIDKNESRRTRRPPSTSSNKSEPFIIKFPQEQIQNKKTKDILKGLNKPMESDLNFRNNNLLENISGLKASNAKKDDGKKKPYVESYNKIGQEPKNIFGDEEIEEDYGDFENMDGDKDKKNENKNDWEDMFGENANFNDIDEERVLKPQKINKNKSKREQIIERLNDIKNIVLLTEEYFEFISIDKNNDNLNDNMGFNVDGNNGKIEKGVNTDVITYKNKATATDERFDFNNEKDKDENHEEDNNNDNKEAHLPLYNQNEKEKKSKIIISSYQPLSYDSYNVFIKTAPVIESMLLNNINKYILQKKADKRIEENTGMQKLSMEFNFPNDLLSYMFHNNSNKIKIDIDKFLFFDTKPYLIAFSLSLSVKDSSGLSFLFGDNFGNINCANLIMFYDIYTQKTIKILYSQSKVNDMVAIGEGENLLVTVKVGGELDIYDISLKGSDDGETDDKYYMGFEAENSDNQSSLARINIEQKNTPVNNNPKYKLILPIFSSYNFLRQKNDENNQDEENSTNKKGFNSQVKKMIKVINKNNNDNDDIEQLYELFIFDQTGYLISFQFYDTDIRSSARLEYIFSNPYTSTDLNPLIKRCFNMLPEDMNNIKEEL